MVTYKKTSTKMASSQVGTELEALSETHIGDLSEAYNIGVLSPAHRSRSRFKALIKRFERKFWPASSTSSQLVALKDLGTLHTLIFLLNARIASWREHIDVLTERAETGTDSGQDARKELVAARENLNTAIAKCNASIEVAQHIVRKLAIQPPNLILNVHNTFPKSGELWAFAMIWMALQFVAVAIPAIMTYHWKEPKGTKPVQDYAYPTFLLGTCLLFVSIALCSYIIEATTVEQVFLPTDDYGVENIFRLQLQQNMGDQPFKTYVILNNTEDKKIRTSRYDHEETLRYDPRNHETSVQEGSSESGSYDPTTRRRERVRGELSRTAPRSRHAADQPGKPRTKVPKSMVIIAVILCFVGFICQFVGLRALHWSATVIQLGITLLMTCIRAWIRRGISNQPITFYLPDSDPNWIALSLGTACRNGWPPGKKPWPTKIAPRFQLCNALPETRSVPVIGLLSNDDPRIQLRRKLQSLSTTDDGDLLPQAQALLSSMHVFFISLDPRNLGRSRPITWAHIVESSGLIYPGLRNSRLILTVSFEYDPFQESEQEVLYRSILHALLSILRHESGPIPAYRCVTRVRSQEDWMRKRDFLMAHLKLTPAHENRYVMSFLSTTGHLSSYYGGSLSRRPMWEHNHMFAGTSIDDMQPSTATSPAGSNSSYGYLLVPQLTKIDHVPELLAGFMDAACREVNPKYDHVMKSWYVDFEGSHRAWIKLDYIVDNFKAMQLAIPEVEVKILVIASLARCTVWKDSALADEPNPASVPLPKPSSRTTLQRPSSSQSSKGFF